MDLLLAFRQPFCSSGCQCFPKKHWRYKTVRMNIRAPEVFRGEKTSKPRGQKLRQTF